jgi:hypothetical protein
MGDPPRMPADKRKHKHNPLSLHPLLAEEALKRVLGGSTGQTVPEATVPGAKPKRTKK